MMIESIDENEKEEEQIQYHNDNFTSRIKKTLWQLDLSSDIHTKVARIKESAFLTKQDIYDIEHGRVSINYLYQKHKILEERFVVDQMIRKNRTEEEVFEEAARLKEENRSNNK